MAEKTEETYDESYDEFEDDSAEHGEEPEEDDWFSTSEDDEAHLATLVGGTQPFLAYSADSFFKSRVDAAQPVDTTRTAAFHKFMLSQADQKGFSAPTIKGLTASQRWGTVFAVGQASDPVWKVNGSIPPDVAILKTQGFHAPATLGQDLTGTSDSPFVVHDFVNHWSVWCSKTSKGSGNTINIAAGGSAGMFQHASNGLDKRNPKSNSKVNFRSRGAIPDGMVIRRDLIDYAIANNTGLGHVLHMFMCETNKSDGHCHPMVGEEAQSGWGAEGERIYIRKDVDVTKLGLTPFGLAIARTLQQHGAYLGDNAGRESTLKAQQATSRANPWSGLSGGVSDTVLQGKVKWDMFNVAPKGWQ